MQNGGKILQNGGKILQNGGKILQNGGKILQNGGKVLQNGRTQMKEIYNMVVRGGLFGGILIVECGVRMLSSAEFEGKSAE